MFYKYDPIVNKDVADCWRLYIEIKKIFCWLNRDGTIDFVLYQPINIDFRRDNKVSLVR